MLLKRFEDIQAWQEARILARMVYSLSQKPSFKKDFGLSLQIRRACISIMANIAEGFERRSKKEFIKFLNIASASASEVQSHLYAALDQKYIGEEEFQSAYAQSQRAKSLINGFISYLNRKIEKE